MIKSIREYFVRKKNNILKKETQNKYKSEIHLLDTICL